MQWLTAEGIFIEEIKIDPLDLIFDIVEILFIECLCWRLEWILFDRIPIEKIETKLIQALRASKSIDFVVINKKLKVAGPSMGLLFCLQRAHNSSILLTLIFRNFRNMGIIEARTAGLHWLKTGSGCVPWQCACWLFALRHPPLLLGLAARLAARLQVVPLFQNKWLGLIGKQLVGSACGFVSFHHRTHRRVVALGQGSCLADGDAVKLGKVNDLDALGMSQSLLDPFARRLILYCWGYQFSFLFDLFIFNTNNSTNIMVCQISFAKFEINAWEHSVWFAKHNLVGCVVGISWRAHITIFIHRYNIFDSWVFWDRWCGLRNQLQLLGNWLSNRKIPLMLRFSRSFQTLDAFQQNQIMSWRCAKGALQACN